MSEPDGLRRIRERVADCLALDPAEVGAGSRLFADLGADSLDFVELLFTLEKEFGVKLGQDDLSFLTRLDLSDPEVMKGGYLTPAIVGRAARWIPEVAAADPAKLTPRDLWSMVTVETLWRVIEEKLRC